jgi:dihydropteroate synthase
VRVQSLDPANPIAMQSALTRAGMDPVRVDALIDGSLTVGLLVSDLPGVERDHLLHASHENPVDAVSGDGWVFLHGTVAHLAGLTRPRHSILSDDLAHALRGPLRGLTDPITQWQTGTGPIDVSRPLVAGIVNITPDSFSDGGEFLDPAAARRRAGELVADGADVIDVGGHSTKPGAEAVSTGEEWNRLRPALEAIVSEVPGVPISVDTFRSEIARRSIDAGASIINDVSGLRFDDSLASVCSTTGAGLVLMHSRGDLSTMASYEHVDYGDIVFDVASELTESVNRALDAGVDREAIVVDPGLGFGKKGSQNHELLARLSDFAALGFPVMVGPSRKRFVREMVGSESLSVVDEATSNICVLSWLAGARLFRVHRSDQVRRALDVISACREM